MSFHEKYDSRVAKYYRGKINEFGATPRGVDWNDEYSQQLRFDILINLSNHLLTQKCRVLDYGCGYGELAATLQNQNYDVIYTGYDLVNESIARARKRFSGHSNVSFTNYLDKSLEFDIVFASGVFNVLFASSDQWLCEYVKPTLGAMCLRSSHLVLNFLKPNPTKPSNKLFFPSLQEISSVLPPEFKVMASREDYALWEWTVLIEGNVKAS